MKVLVRLFSIAMMAVTSMAAPKITDKVFFDLELDGEAFGRIEFHLFGRSCKQTVKNFVALAEGSAGVGKQGYPLHYKGSKFHRIIPGFMVQGGDITLGNGAGGESIYGNRFADETFIHKNKPYQLAMSNDGPNTNNS